MTNRLLAWILFMVAVIAVNVMAFDGLLFYLILKIGKSGSLSS